jgi:acyl carrier protein
MAQFPTTELLKAFLGSQSRQPLTEELTESSPLIELGVIDSVVVVALASFVEEQFSVCVPDEGIPIAELRDLRTLGAWVQSLAAAETR